MKYTIHDFKAQFPDDKACLAYLYKVRYPRGAPCIKCQHKNCFYPIEKRRAYVCSWCGNQIYPTAGTIFHKSSTSLVSWFHAIFLMSQSRNGVAAMEIQRHIGVTYKCAWRIAKQIRLLMRQGIDPLGGMLEADETYVGGYRRGKRGRGAEGKTPVFGIVEREGKVRAEVMPNLKADTVIPMLQKMSMGGSILSTDESNLYNKVRSLDYIHSTIKHSANEYARGGVHTNTIEGFWSQFKRSVGGTYHAVSPKYLQKYLDEFCFRYDRRHDDVPLPVSLFSMAGQTFARA